MKPEEIKICKDACRRGHGIDKERFEELKKGISEGIIKQIDNAKNPYRCILLIGGNDDLIDKVVCYFFLQNYKPFNELYYDCFTGRDEKHIETILFSRIEKKSQLRFHEVQHTSNILDEFGQKFHEIQPIHNCIDEQYLERQSRYQARNHLMSPTMLLSWYYTKNYVIFLKGVESNRILERCASDIRELDREEYLSEHAALIISKKDKTGLPENVKGVFDVIYLDPENQDTLASTSLLFNDATQTVTINNKKYPKSKNGNIPDKEYKLLKLLYENRERRTTKKEIEKTCVMGASGESQVFNTVSKLRSIIKGSGLKIHNKKETQNVGGGYQIIIGNTK